MKITKKNVAYKIQDKKYLYSKTMNWIVYAYNPDKENHVIYAGCFTSYVQACKDVKRLKALWNTKKQYYVIN